MRKILVGALVASLALTMISVEAQAKRLGGGGNVGKQQSSISNKDAASPQAPAAQPTPPRQAAAPAAAAAGQAAAQSSKSKWLGPLAGLAAGLGIAALLSHFGMIGPVAEFMANMLMFGLLIVAGLFIWRMIKSRKGGAASASATPAMAGAAAGAGGGSFNQYQPQAQPAPVREPLTSQRNMDTPAQSAGFGGTGGSTVQSSTLTPSSADAPFASLDGSGLPTTSAGFGASTTAAGFGIPAGFEVEPFLRSAKVYYVRLQAAWDAGDVNDIREFTTPEMFAEIKMQLAERAAGTVNVTDVVKLDAELLGVDTTGIHDLASVRFHGLIRETVNGPAEPFDEVWNIAKLNNGGWVLAGIQQLGQADGHSGGTLH